VDKKKSKKEIERPYMTLEQKKNATSDDIINPQKISTPYTIYNAGFR